MARRNLQSIVVKIIPSDIEYRIITIPRAYRRFLPGYKEVFDLERDNAQTRPAWMSSATDRDFEEGDRDAGLYICGRLREWYENNSIRVGDKTRITRLKNPITDKRRAYRLTHVPQRSP